MVYFSSHQQGNANLFQAKFLVINKDYKLAIGPGFTTNTLTSITLIDEAEF